MLENNFTLKDRVRAFWQENPCGTKFADAPPGSRKFYELVEEHRYTKEWHIPDAAGFSQTKNLSVLEVGCGLGTDGAQFAKAGAIYTGIDLTDAAVDLARRRFEIFNLPGTFRVADAERLDFPDNSFDLVYSHGVLHHTPDTQAAIREIHRVLRPGGRAVVMLYHRDSDLISPIPLSISFPRTACYITLLTRKRQFVKFIACFVPVVPQL